MLKICRRHLDLKADQEENAATYILIVKQALQSALKCLKVLQSAFLAAQLKVKTVLITFLKTPLL